MVTEAIHGKPLECSSILHVAETLKGGIASYLDEILPSQVSKFGSVCLLVPSGQDVQQYKDLGVSVNVFQPSRLRFNNILLLICAIFNLLKFNRIDLVHAHSTFAGVAVRIAFRLLSRHTKVIYCSHGWAFDRVATKYVNYFYGRIELTLSYLTDAIICISNHDYQSAKNVGISQARLILISNAISSKLPFISKVEWPDVSHRLLFIGRFDKQKGVDIFIDAMRDIGSDVFAYLIGCPVLDEDNITSLPANVKAIGWLPRDMVQQYILSTHVVVVPSRWEGFGLTALEAMRANKPVIASRVGGLVELVIDGKTGFLVDPNSTSDLLNKMRKCFNGSVDLYQLGLAARDHFEQNFTADRLNKELFLLYSTLLRA